MAFLLPVMPGGTKDIIRSSINHVDRINQLVNNDEINQ